MRFILAIGHKPCYNHLEEVIAMNIKQDDTINILMIGNSFCYYFVEELYGLAKAAGIKMRVCNVYYSGCRLEQHYNWWKEGAAKYEFFTTDKNGRVKTARTSLDYCLNQQNWDVISLQEPVSQIRITSNRNVQAHLIATQVFRTALLNHIKERFPASRLFWHQTWSNQLGYDRNGYKIETTELQDADAALMREYSIAVCKESALERVNTGDAWQTVRHGGYDNLCARRGVNGDLGDYYHDGDIGGGQYLNACVWFEAITGQSCIGNTYRPDYPYDEALITTFQEAAHQAITKRNAEDAV